MLQLSEIRPFIIIPSEQNPQNANIVTVLEHIEHDNSDSFGTSSPSVSTSTSIESCMKQDIYVCTFCQVFSPLLSTVVDHISTLHLESLPSGTKPKDFVSKLQSLHGNPAKVKRKVGRPKKSKENCQADAEPKIPPTEPTPGPDGLFWCKTCLRYFKKPRQLTQHICLNLEEQDGCSDESPESCEESEFRIDIDIDPVPWARRKKHSSLKKSESSSAVESLLNSTTKFTTDPELPENSDDAVIPDWRNDPSYVPLFQDENEKAAFEEHLKSIDYSYVDSLFQAEEKRCRNNNKKNCVHVQSVIYSCNHCKKVLKSLSHIRLHCLTHTDFKPFTCPKCSYRSNSKGSLYMHMRIHTGNVFCCSVCDFKCFKRSHLLDHEATHSSIPQLCKLCKNSYKTQRSLIAHIRKYHNNPGGKKYIISLTSKQRKEFKCDICKKKFKSVDILTNHNRICHENNVNHDKLETDLINNHSEHISKTLNDEEDMPIEHSPANVQSKESLADSVTDIVLSNLLQQEPSQSILYENVFHQTSENILPEPSDDLLEGFQTKTVSDSSILADCQKTLDILNECLQNDFPNECPQEFSLQSDLPSEQSLQNSTESNSENVRNLEEIPESKCEEPKPAEIKLFEKCQRAPAYVCCVCSAIYICPSTLKVHLKEHVNNPSSSLIVQSDEQFETTKMSESNDLDVCEILQGATDTCSYDEELEKLYTSSLDMKWYLPEVSVVLQNDPALFDSMLDDISNFPISDKYDTSDDLDVRDTDESVLKCFDEL